MTKTYPGETQLYQVGLDPADYRIDVVFLHGLGGDWETTWGGESESSAFWPRWIAEDVAQARIWSAQYPAVASKWQGRSLSFLGIVTSLLDRMSAKKLGDKPIVFVCHSLGGLVAKQVMRTALDLAATDSWREIGKAVRGILFIATPHSGAGLANFITTFARGLSLIGSIFRPTDALVELQKNSDQLEDLGDWYRVAAVEHKIKTMVYAEAHEVHGAVMVVPRSGSNPGIAGVKPVELAFDHFEICKPLNRTFQVYDGALKFIQSLVDREQKKTLKKPNPRRPKPAGVGPKLELALIEPKKSISVLPKAVGLASILPDRLNHETERMGIQSLDWVKRILNDYYAKRHLTANLVADEGERIALLRSTDTATPLEAYALVLSEWYRGVLMETALRLQKETEAARVVTINFHLANSGILPAEEVKIELRVKPAVPVKFSRPEPTVVYSSASAPLPELALGLPSATSARRPEIGRFYDVLYDQRRPLPANTDIRLFEDNDPIDNQPVIVGSCTSLHHGKTVKLYPFFAVFGERIVDDLTIEYKLFSENQPIVGVGEFYIKVTE